jgi:hypothetical protein
MKRLRGRLTIRRSTMACEPNLAYGKGFQTLLLFVLRFGLGQEVAAGQASLFWSPMLHVGRRVLY